LIDGVDARTGRSAVASLDHLRHNILRSGEQRFDRAIPAIAHPAFKAEFNGGHYRPGAKPDTLHATADDDHNSHDHPH
jgi:hypothetical protein